jgi:hypothetical protein
MTTIRSERIELVPIEEIKLNPKNYNKHSEDQIERLAKLIDNGGYRVPVIISNRSGILISGEGRYLASKKLGLAHIPAIYQDFDSEEQEVAFGISENAIASWAEIDLSGINADLGDFGPDFDLELFGIKNFNIDASGVLDGFEEPASKDGPSTKETELIKCPNCGTLVG